MTAELDRLVDVIDGRIASIHAEIASLEVARSALDGGGVAAVRERLATAQSDHRKPAGGREAPRRPPAAPRRRRPARELSAGDLERLLEAEAGADGLSAAELARRAGASRAQTLARLGDLERAGLVRAVDGRRWRLLSDDERVALRVAELERQQVAAAGSRRGPRRGVRRSAAEGKSTPE